MIDYPELLAAAWEQHLAPKRIDAPTVISTFAGCGGSSLGYSMAGFRELLAVEWEQNSVDTFRLNFPDVPVYHGDIAALSVDECLRMTGLQPGELDILDGSPPCQGFSTAGKRNMDDSRNQLFREYVRLLRGLMPRVFVMENVSGMVKGKMKLIFAEILRELKSCGYRVSARLLNAMYFNVPQSRQRMIFIGVRDDLDIEPSHPKAESRPVTIRQALPWIESARVIHDTSGLFSEGDVTERPCPSVLQSSQPLFVTIEGANGYNEHEHHGIDQPMPTVQSGRPVRVARHETDSRFVSGFSAGETLSIDSVLPIVMKDGYAGSGHSQYVVETKLISNSSYRETMLATSSPSPTITKTSPDHSVAMIRGADVERRKFTIDEVKRICSFPDPFQMIGSYNQQWSRLGNSVPPLFMRSIAKHINQVILSATPALQEAAD